MKNETMMDILMVVAIVLVMVGALAIWGLYSLGVSIPWVSAFPCCVWSG